VGSNCGFTWPVEYWLAFILPFLPLTFLPAVAAYYTWTFLSVAMIAFAVWRIASVYNAPHWPLLAIALLSFPVVFGLFQGQVHGWQVLALTESWLAIRRGAERAGGLWLSLLLVKPQFLPLLLLYLLWIRRWRTLIWFTIGGALWALATVALLGGVEGIIVYLDVLLNGAGTIATPGVVDMVSWRSYALHLFGVENRSLAIMATIVLSLLTVALLLRRVSQEGMQERFGPHSLLAVMAASVLIGYDTHIYSMSLVLPPALALLASVSQAPASRVRLASALLDFALVGPLAILAAGSLLFPAHAGIGWSLAKLALFTGVVSLFAYTLAAPKSESPRTTASQLAVATPS
jgi:hypothetical protein